MKTKVTPPHHSSPVQRAKIEICILAGGLSSRMGRDKSKLRLGRTTLLARIRRTAKILDFPVRVIRRDLVPRCGPLGGIYTALKTTAAETVLFLACDMPQISETFLRNLVKEFKSGAIAVFTWTDDTAGFPFVLRRAALPKVEQLMSEKKHSLQILSKEIRAKKFRPAESFKTELINVNSPKDWENLKTWRGKL